MIETDESPVVARRLAKLCTDFARKSDTCASELEKAGIKLEEYTG